MVGFALTAAFYVRWNDAWFRQHADEEFRLKRLDLDIDRAHYVVEMLLEWNEQKGTTIPEELIKSLTASLFTTAESDVVRHPYEDLANALLGASAGLRMTPSGFEVALNRKGLQKFRKAAADAVAELNV
jgi:hypothetical protein